MNESLKLICSKLHTLNCFIIIVTEAISHSYEYILAIYQHCCHEYHTILLPPYMQDSMEAAWLHEQFNNQNEYLVTYI